jgi:hypothetical protein
MPFHLAPRDANPYQLALLSPLGPECRAPIMFSTSGPRSVSRQSLIRRHCRLWVPERLTMRSVEIILPLKEDKVCFDLR